MESGSDDDDFLSADEGDEDPASNLSLINTEFELTPDKEDDEGKLDEKLQMGEIGNEGIEIGLSNHLESFDDASNSNVNAVICGTPNINVIENDISNPSIYNDEHLKLHNISENSGKQLDNKLQAEDIPSSCNVPFNTEEMQCNESDISVEKAICTDGTSTGKTEENYEKLDPNANTVSGIIDVIPTKNNGTRKISECEHSVGNHSKKEWLGNKNENSNLDIGKDKVKNGNLEDIHCSIDTLSIDEEIVNKDEEKEAYKIDKIIASVALVDGSTKDENLGSLEDIDKKKEDYEKYISANSSSKDNIDGNSENEVLKVSGQDNDDVTTFCESPDETSWGWDSWTDNFISQATTKVSSLIETVEEHLGIPDPAQLAHQMKAMESESDDKNEKCCITGNSSSGENQKQTSDLQQEESASSWFSSFVPVASLTNIVQMTSQDLVTGGIDALEFIGKTTVNYLSEGDPGLRNKREHLFKKKGSTLSAILQEAKVKAEERESPHSFLKGEDPKKLNDMLEKFQAIAHLDALEMLSSDSQTKLKRILNVQSELAKDDSIHIINNIKDSFELVEAEGTNTGDVDFKKELFAATKKLQIKVTCSKLLNTWSKIEDKTKDLSNFENSEICFEIFISSLAEFVSRCIEYYRKVADMLLMMDFQAKQLNVERASILKSISEMFQCEISGLVNKFANYLDSDNDDKKASDFITDIYLEGSNCLSLVQDSHILLLPILQCSAIK